MDELYGKRILVIGGKEQVYDNIDDLGEEIEMCQSELHNSHILLTDDVDKPVIDRIFAKARAQRDRIDAYTAWLEEQKSAKYAEIAELRDALRNLPASPFVDES